ncbi:MAG: hypothetical protein ABI407_07240 [Bradyrhizobium sp.]
MISFPRLIEPEGAHADGPTSPSEPDIQWPVFLKTIAELADPTRSDIVKGWLQSELRSPK